MRVFTGGETWTGGFYELALEYERDSGGVVDGLNALWKLEDIEGCYLDSAVEPTDQPRRTFEPSLLAAGHLYGVASCPGGLQIACGSCTVEEADGSDWLVFYLPMSALGRVYPVGGFPFDAADHELAGAAGQLVGRSCSQGLFPSPLRAGPCWFRNLRRRSCGGSGCLRAPCQETSRIARTRYRQDRVAPAYRSRVIETVRSGQDNDASKMPSPGPRHVRFHVTRSREPLRGARQALAPGAPRLRTGSSRWTKPTFGATRPPNSVL